MYKSLKVIAVNPLISGSFFLFSGGILASFFNFLFNLLMSRNLSIPDYGTLISLISIVTLLSIPSGALTPTIVTIAGGYFAKKEKDHIHAFYLKLLRDFLLASTLLFMVFLIFSSQITSFFKIDNISLFGLTIIGVCLFYISGLNNSFLQAKLSFKFLSFTNISSAFLKVMLAFMLVLLGWGLTGALLGFVLSLIGTILIGVYYFRDFIIYKSSGLPKISYKSLLSFGIPSAIVIFCLNSLISSDILLVKHFFNPHDAGLYAGMSLIGRVIYFLSAPIGIAMFPILIKRRNNQQDYKKIFYLAVAAVFTLSSLVTIFYMIFTNFSILFFLKNPEYLVVSKYVIKFSIFISLYSIVSVLVYYFLSINKTKFSYAMVVGAFSQIILISVFHNDFDQVINASIFSVLILLAFSAYFLKFDSKNAPDK